MSESDHDDPLPRHVIHLPIVVHTLPAALDFAARLAASLAFLPEIDADEVTVSVEDAQHVHHRVFCDWLLLGGGRCGERENHRGDCVPSGTSPAAAGSPPGVPSQGLRSGR